MNKKILTILVLLLLVAGGGYAYSTYWKSDSERYAYSNSSADMIKLDLVKPGNLVLPEFTVTGEARGPWYFEGSFPVEVLDKDGKQLAQAQAAAVTDWMTEEFVPFRVTLNVGAYSGPATLVLHRDNPSGLPENDADLTVPIEVFDVQ